MLPLFGGVAIKKNKKSVDLYGFFDIYYIDVVKIGYMVHKTITNKR